MVNKNYEKSFSEYSNELKINYAIQELIDNPVYRKYSTQAIAESVGFKNVVSFTKSFKKRAGVSPAQFISKIIIWFHLDEVIFLLEEQLANQYYQSSSGDPPKVGLL